MHRLRFAVLIGVIPWLECGSPSPPPSQPEQAASASPTTHALTFSVQGTGGAVRGGSYECRTSCTISSTSQATVTMSAIADPGYAFDGWSGACSGRGDCRVVLDEDRSVTATFSLLPPPPPPPT